MTLTEMEKEIIKAIREDSKLPLANSYSYKYLMGFVRRIFKEYRNGS